MIEIIAVLVILGILAAVAVPKYTDLLSDARKKALEGATSSLITSAAMNYAKQILAGTASATAFTPNPATGIVVGDFAGKVDGTGGTYTATVTAAPTGYTSAEMTAASRSFKLF